MSSLSPFSDPALPPLAAVDAALERAWSLREIDCPRALELARDAQAELRAAPDGGARELLAAKAYLVSAIALHRLGRYAEGLREARAAVAGYTAAGGGPGALRAETITTLLEVECGEAERSTDRISEHLARATEAGDAGTETEARLALGISRYFRGELAAALADFEAAGRSAQFAGEKVAEARSSLKSGNIHFEFGDYAAAAEAFHHALVLFDEVASPRGAALTQIGLGRVHQRLEEFELGLECFQRAARVLATIGNAGGRASAEMHAGRCLLELGRRVEAERALRLGLELAEASASRAMISQTLTVLGRLLNDDGRHAEAAAAFDRAVQLCESTGEELLLIEAITARGRLPLPAGPDREAAAASQEDSLRRALALAEKTSSLDLLFACHAALAAHYKERGHFADALRHHEQFHALRERVINERSVGRTRRLQASNRLERMRHEAEIARLRTVELAAALEDAERLRRTAEEAARFKTEVLAIVGHDLRSLVGQAASSADLLAAELGGSPEHGELVGIITRATRQTLRLLEDLLQSAQLETAGAQLELEPLEFVALARTAAEDLRFDAGRKRQVLSVVAEGTAEVLGDRLKLEQVVGNLVGNAVKYTPPGGHLQVRIWREGRLVHLAVSDDGLGLRPEDMPRLFGKFQKLSARPTGGETSTGLGLAIVKQIVEAHDGRIRAESPGAGRGSTFFVELPAL